MKRLLRCNVPTITIDIVVSEELSSVAAGRLIEHPKSIARRKRLSEIKLTILNDVAASARSVVVSRGFTITKEYQSKKSYTYYFQFDVDAEGRTVPVGVKFRISTTSMHGDPNTTENTKVVIRSFRVRDFTIKERIALLDQFERISDELKQGNLSILDEYVDE